MDSSSREVTKEDTLNASHPSTSSLDSWVDLHFQHQLSTSQSSTTSSTTMAPTTQTLSGINTPEIRPHSGLATPEIRPHAPLCSGQMEKLLLDAQRESCGSSRYSSQPSSSRGSPKSPHSPNNELAPQVPPIMEGQVLQAVQNANIPTDWIWDWSSRPEALPQPHNNGNGAGSDISSHSGTGSRYTHRSVPPSRRHRLSVRNSPVLSDAYGAGLLDHMRTLLVTHACSFILGAAAMFLYLKKYCNWTPKIQTTSLVD